MENIVSGITENWKSVQKLIEIADITTDFKYLLRDLPYRACYMLPITCCAIIELNQEESKLDFDLNYSEVQTKDYPVKEFLEEQYDLISSLKTRLTMKTFDEFSIIVEPLKLDTLSPVYLLIGADEIQLKNPLVEVSFNLIAKTICDCYEFNKHKDATKGYNLLIRKFAHEIKCPLNSIYQQSQEFKQQDSLSLESIQSIQYASSHVIDLIDEILYKETDSDFIDYTKPNKSWFNAKKALEDTFRTMHSIMKEKNIDISYKNIDTEIYADVKMFRQVVYNLANNALKFAWENSDIEVISYISDNKYWFEVRNQGESINSQEKEYIFEAGKQGKQALENNIKGKGLGLAICKQIANSHGGDIICNNDIESETTFIVSISYENTRF